MKKFFLSLILFLFLFHAANALAANNYSTFMPSYANSIKYYGEGALRISNHIIIYENKNENSKIIQEIYWNNAGKFLTTNKNSSKKPSEIFLAFVPNENIALFSGEKEDEIWTKICYDQKNGLFGYIKEDTSNKTSKFYYYKDLFFKFGKKHGIYIFKNLPEENKTLHSAPRNNSPVVDVFDIPKFIIPWLVQGNWMLVKISTYDGKTKTGWFKWRDDNGKLQVFISF